MRTADSPGQLFSPILTLDSVSEGAPLTLGLEFSLASLLSEVDGSSANSLRPNILPTLSNLQHKYFNSSETLPEWFGTSANIFSDYYHTHGHISNTYYTSCQNYTLGSIVRFPQHVKWRNRSENKYHLKAIIKDITLALFWARNEQHCKVIRSSPKSEKFIVCELFQKL